MLVHSAGTQDRDGAVQLISRLYHCTKNIKHIWADGGYAGQLVVWVYDFLGWTLEIVKRTKLHMFEVLPRRWVVERTFAWIGFYRRNSKDYEHTTTSAEAFCYIAMVRIMLKRLNCP